MSEVMPNCDQIDEGWDQFSRFTIKLKSKLKSIENFDENMFLNEFKSLDNNKNRINFMVNNRDVVKCVQQLYEDIVHSNQVNDNHNKSLIKSKQFRQKADNCFKNGFFSDSIRHYSLAVCLAPFPSEKSSEEESIELSLAFADRSRVLFRVEDYESCLEDIEESIRYNCPKHIKHEILLRKAQCLTSLAKNELALQVLNGLKEDMIESKESIAEELSQQMEKLFIEINSETNETNDENSDNFEMNDENNDSNEEIENCNQFIPNASDSVRIEYSARSGRTMSATKDIKFSDILLVEAPFAEYLYNDKYDSYCQNCLTALENRSVPCFGCSQIRFCNDLCRQNCWTRSHSSECNSLLLLSKDIGISYIVLRIVLRTGITNALKISEQMSENPIDYQKNEVLYSSDYSSVYGLLDHQNDHNLDSMVSYSLTALFILLALEKKSLITRDQNFITFGALILKHIQQLSTNLISVLDQDFCDEINKFGFNANEEIIGTAIYPTISLLNHSCDPNILTFFNGSKLIVKASRSIRSGEEINYCYGPNYQRMSRKDRQTLLTNQYYFECQCFVCANKKENLTRALLCHQCNGPVIHNEDYTSECLNCKSNGLDVRKAIDNLENGLKHSTKGNELLNREELSEALISLHLSDQFLTLNLYIQNRILSKSKDDLCRCYALMGHFDRAVIYCLQSIKITSLIFGEQSTELLMELIKLISLKWEVVDETTDPNNRKIFANELLDHIKRADNIVSKLKSTEGFENAFQSELKFINEKRVSVLQMV